MGNKKTKTRSKSADPRSRPLTGSQDETKQKNQKEKEKEKKEEEVNGNGTGNGNNLKKSKSTGDMILLLDKPKRKLTPAMKLTTTASTSTASPHGGEAVAVTVVPVAVVSILVEIVGCTNLNDLPYGSCIDPYVKVKLGKPTTFKKGAQAIVDLHKTKPIKNTINPQYSRCSHSSFAIDGMLVEEELYNKYEGLIFKVKHAKHQLGYCFLSAQQLLAESNLGGHNIVMELFNPNTMLPDGKNTGSLTLRLYPLMNRQNGLEYWRKKGFGYFKDYEEVTPPPPTTTLTPFTSNAKELEAAHNKKGGKQQQQQQQPQEQPLLPNNTTKNKKNNKKKNWKKRMSSKLFGSIIGSANAANNANKNDFYLEALAGAGVTTVDSTPTIAVSPSSNNEVQEEAGGGGGDQNHTGSTFQTLVKDQQQQQQQQQHQKMEALLGGLRDTSTSDAHTALSTMGEDPYYYDTTSDRGEAESEGDFLDVHTPKIEQGDDTCLKTCCFALPGW